MWNSFNIELFENGVFINSLYITPDFFNQNIPTIKEELAGAYLMMYNEVPRKDFFLPNYQGWDVLTISLTQDNLLVASHTINRVDFDALVSGSSLEDTLYSLYILVTEE